MSAAGLWAAGRWVNPFSDQGFSWSLAYRLSKGERLYRDIYLPYTPLSPYLLAAGIRVFGASSRYLLLVNWIPAAFLGVLLLRCGRPLLSLIERLALVGVVIAASLLVAGDGRLVFPYYPGVVHALAFSTGALLLLRRDTDRSGRTAFLAGLLAGLAFCCKQEIGIAILFALAAVVLTRPARPIAWLALLFAGFSVVLLPAAVWILSLAPVASLRMDSHFWPLDLTPPPATRHLMRMVSGLSDPNWPLALREATFRILWLAALLALMALLLARERKRSAWTRTLVLVTALGLWWLVEGSSFSYPFPYFSLSMLVAFLVAVLALVVPSITDRAFLVAFGTFAGLAGARNAFSRFVTGHYDGPGHFASSLTWVLFLCIFVPRLLLGKARAASCLRTLMALLLLVVSCWLSVGGIESLRFPLGATVETREGPVFVNGSKARFLNAIARNSVAGERVLIIPQTEAVDVLFHLESVSPVIDLLPPWLDEHVEQRIIEKLERSRPDLVVLFDRPVPEYGTKPFGQGYGLLLADWCSRNYRVVESSSAGKILRPRGDAGSRAVPPFDRAPVYNPDP
jgi:4-amino-4-deoxy-L-arabinose transferase-like glycosyltransferase